MNKILGIVSEYNPFHNGHIVHLRQSIESTQSQFVIAVMSGNFIQRGDTAIVDKWTRAEMALRQGVDLVIELPTVYATSSAENFAYGAIKILDSIGIVDYVSFGSECGNINLMADIADVLNDEPQEYSQLLHDQLQLGRSFPSAREIAINEYFLGNTTYTNILKSPNNILGIEYIKALQALNSNIIPITIRRNYVDYNSTSPDLEKGIASASAIRTMIQNANFLVSKGFECDIYVEEDYMNDSESLKKRIIDYYGECKCNTYVGISMRKDYDLVFLGRLIELKQPLLFLDMVSEIKKKIPNVRACMIGNGEMYSDCIKKIKEDGLGENVDMLGFQSNPFPYVKHSKVAVLPSKFEGLPMSVIECMILDTLVVNSGVGGLKEMYSGYEQYICHDLNEYVECLLKLLRKEKKDYHDICQAIVRDYIDIKKYSRSIKVIYQDIYK